MCSSMVHPAIVAGLAKTLVVAMGLTASPSADNMANKSLAMKAEYVRMPRN